MKGSGDASLQESSPEKDLGYRGGSGGFASPENLKKREAQFERPVRSEAPEKQKLSGAQSAGERESK